MNFDPYIPLHDSGTYSVGDGKSAWLDVTPDELRTLLQGGSPPLFRTALAKLDEDVFAGPLYFDLDDEDIEESISALCKLLDKLEATGLDLASVRLFATGKKGFHLEVPAACFMPKPGPVEYLPRVLKEMAIAIYVDGVDLRVYSLGRGRLWRVPNIKRENGCYKVPLTLDEVRAMTRESYAELVSSPRDFMPLAAPTLCAGLATLFAKARDTGRKPTRAKSWTAAETELRQRFAGACPPSVAAVLKGEAPSPLGFNFVAMQVCLLGHVLGWDEDRLISECAGLIAHHEGDGGRYNTPRRRENELRRMFVYVDGNPTYAFSVGGLRSILPPGTHAPDLQGLEADTSEDTPDYVELLDAADGDAGEVVAVARRVAADPTLSRTEAEGFIKRAAKSAGVSLKVLRSDLWQPGNLDDGRTVIRVQRSDFAASVDSALSVLPSVPSLRVRSGQLVEVMRSGKIPTIATVSHARLAYILSQRARWSYGDSDGAPDPGILQAVLAAGQWPGVPELVGLLHQPTIGDDGEIFADEGNHRGMESVFDPQAFPMYSGSATDALIELRGLLAEFAFASVLDESATLAAILTAAARPMLRLAPAFLVTAHDYGSGKSFLAELITLFASDCTTMSRWAQRSEEQDKALTALLLEGRPAIVFDNLITHWQSATLAKILTEEMHGDRVLGVSANANVSTRCLIVGTGNNIAPIRDISRRVLTIELDPRCENPMLRQFNGDPVSEVRANRGRWVMLALKVLQDFKTSGSAPTLPPIASYGEWSRLIRGALVHYGLPDPLRAVVRNVEQDEDRDTLGHILEVWRECFKDEPITLREVLQTLQAMPHLKPYGELRHLLEEVATERGEINPRILGNWLKGRSGRVVGKLRLVAGAKGRAGVTWQVLEV